MNPIGVRKKDPVARLDYTIDWKPWLDNGDHVAAVAWSIENPPDETLLLDSPILAGSLATVFVSGGTEGANYEVRCQVTTAAGRIDARTLLLSVVRR